MAVKAVANAGELLAGLDGLAWGHVRQKDAAGLLAPHVHQARLVHLQGERLSARAGRACLQGVLESRADAHQKANDAVLGLAGALLVDRPGLLAKERERVRVPHLPVVVERGGVERGGFAHEHARHAEELGELARLLAELALVGDAHVGEKPPAQVKARELDAERVALHGIEEPRGDALRGLALVVAREHAVDVGVVDRPKALVDVHGERVDGRHDDDLLGGVQQVRPFEGGEPAHEVGRDKGLLHLVAAHGTHDGAARLGVRVAEYSRADRERLAIRGLERKEGLVLHGYSPSRMRPKSEPG